MSDVSQIEKFVPVLPERFELFELSGADFGVFVNDESYILIPHHEARFVKHINGERTLSEIINAAAKVDGKLLSIRCLLKLVQRLSHNDALANDESELKAYGLHGEATASTPAERILNALFNQRFSEAGLGPAATTMLSVLKPLRASTEAFSLLIAFATILSIYLSSQITVSLGQEPLLLDGSYGRGMFSLYLGAVVALTLRQLFRGWCIVASGYQIYGAGVELPLMIIGPSVDGRHMFRDGPAGELRLATAGIAGSILSTCILLTSMSVYIDVMPLRAQMLALATIGSIGVNLATLCPFLPGDLGDIFDRFLPGGNARLHANTYLQKRYIKGLGKTNTFRGEQQLLVMIVIGIFWLYAMLVFSSRLTTGILLPSAASIFAAGFYTEKLVLGLLLFATAATLAGVVITFIMAAMRIAVATVPAEDAKPESVSLQIHDVADALNSNPIFASISSEARSGLASHARAFRFKKGEAVISQGDTGDAFFMVSTGTARVVTAVPSGVEETVAILNPGDSFGEMALIDSEMRNASVVALEPLTVFSIQRSAFLDGIQDSGIAPEKVTNLLRSSSTLRRSQVFRDMDATSLVKLLSLCERTHHSEGHVLTSQGDAGEHFFIIETGGVDVTQDNEAEPIAQLGPGDFFGEIALLCDIKRTATVTAREDSTILSLNRNDFGSVVTHDFLAGVQLEHVAHERRRGKAS